MRTGRLSIARGPDPATGAAIARPEERPQPAPRLVTVEREEPVPDHRLVHHRLESLERLSRLLDQGALSPEEFAAEKALVLRLRADELVLRDEAPPAAPPRPPRHPSLLGRLFSWKFLPAGLAGGLALSWFAQPAETMRLADQAFRLIGA